MVKRILAVFLAMLLALICADCGSNTSASGTGSTVGTLEGFPWTVELRNAAIKNALHTGAGLKQYDGSVVDVDYDDAPSEGNVFLILTLTITKTGTGGGSFDWAKLSLLDKDKNAYSRMENDAFLQNHQYNRMAGTSLQIGEYKGSICFEVPSGRAKESFVLQYDAGDTGVLTVSVKPS